MLTDEIHSNLVPVPKAKGLSSSSRNLRDRSDVGEQDCHQSSCWGVPATQSPPSIEAAHNIPRCQHTELWAFTFKPYHLQIVLNNVHTEIDEIYHNLSAID